ncbi:MAG: hypothetical protein ACR2MU_00485, partial [Gaiellaceae bacterium]
MPPRVTALTAARRGRVAVELDGAAWRTLPVEAVLGAGLDVGQVLERPRLRSLARALRRHEALAGEGRALRHNDLPRSGIEERLARRGVAPAARAETLAALERAGVVDDVRFAVGRASSLAERGYGDAAIRTDPEGRSISTEKIEVVLGKLEPEAERAAPLAER